MISAGGFEIFKPIVPLNKIIFRRAAWARDYFQTNATLRRMGLAYFIPTTVESSNIVTGGPNVGFNVRTNRIDFGTFQEVPLELDEVELQRSHSALSFFNTISEPEIDAAAVFSKSLH